MVANLGFVLVFSFLFFILYPQKNRAQPNCCWPHLPVTILAMVGDTLK